LTKTEEKPLNAPVCCNLHILVLFLRQRIRKSKRLIFAGYKVTPQWKVGSYRIDLVVEGNDKRLAVECDGDRYHPLDKLGEDMERQAILERMGWIFSRIRGSEFFRDADRWPFPVGAQALAPVFAKLDSLEITPLSEDRKDPLRPSNELTDRVIRRAEELRAHWATRDAEFTPALDGVGN
jgi:REase_MTES_1575